MKLQGLVKVCAAMLFCLSNQQLLAQQLKLGTNPSVIKPSALLELESKKQALLITRITDTTLITNPINGMIIYLEPDNSFRVRANNYWTKLIPEGGTIKSINNDFTPAQTLAVINNPTGTLGFTTPTAGTQTLTIPNAGLTQAGFVSTGAQTFKGLKTFSDGLETTTLRVTNDLGGLEPNLLLGRRPDGAVTFIQLNNTMSLNLGVLTANSGTSMWNASHLQSKLLNAPTPLTDQVLTFNGTEWIAKTPTAAGITSIGLSMPSLFTVTGSPLTANGTITTTLNTQSPNLVFAGPASGSTAAAPAFRSLVAADLPTNSGAYIQNTTTTQTTSNFNISGNGVIGGTLGVGTTTPGNKVEITGPSFTTAAPFNVSGLRLTNLVSAQSAPATSKVLSINAQGDVILTDNPSTTNWLTGGNTATATQFLGTINAVDMVVKYNNKELFRGSRGQTAAESGGTDFSASTLTLLNGATKFNGHPLIIRANGNDVLAFEDATGTPKWHWNILGGGLNFVETNVQDYRLFLQNGGNVGIGTSTPARLLHVAGTMRITGSAGTSTSILGRDGNGDISNVTADATTLAMSGGTLSANSNSNIWNAGEIQGVDVSSTAPTANQVLQYNATTTAWTPATPGAFPIRVVTAGASATVGVAEYSVIVNRNAAFTVTLPNASSVPVGKVVVVRKISTSNVLFTINSAGGNIDGATSLTYTG
ncbi:MAG TPA: hypothetical protein VIP81_07710, partial [Chitinophaga sp.]